MTHRIDSYAKRAAWVMPGRAMVALVMFLMIATACAPSPVSTATPSSSPGATPRSRPVIPQDWPAGKRIVMHVTPSLEKSYVVACDMPVPALIYLKRGHSVTIVVDQEAITAFRRDAAGKSPLDRLDLLEEDKDELPHLLHIDRAAVPKNFGELYRVLANNGVRIVASEDALRAQNISKDQLDPVVTVISAEEVRRIMANLDALLPYDDITPQHPIFSHTPH